MFNPTLVHEYLTFSANKFPDKEALVCGEKRLSYGALDLLSTQLAYGLIECGVKRHDRVVIFQENSTESVIALFGILKAGATFVILHETLKADKLSYILTDSGATMLIAHRRKTKIVSAAVKKMTIKPQVVWLGDEVGDSHISEIESHQWQHFIENSRPDAHQMLPRNIDMDLATLIYTSGSTGEPKGVMTAHFNMISAARSIIQYLENRSEDIIIDALPLSFDYGLYQIIMSVMFGGTVVLESNFMYPIILLQRIADERVTGFPIVPTMAAMLLSLQSITRYNLSSLRYLTNTGAALPVEHILKLKALFPNSRLYSMFGLTECKRVSYLPPEELEKRPSSVGVPMSNCEVFVVDENGQEVPPGVIGELVIRGTNVMRGYWNADELTANTYRPGRIPGETLLYSGDLFRRDEDGYLYFVGRKDDMIKTKGERVSPKEIENILVKMPGVVEAAVIGVPDDILGSAIKTFVVTNSQSEIGKQDIFRHCAENMEVFMVPKYIEFVDHLPKTPNGKVDKKTLGRKYS